MIWVGTWGLKLVSNLRTTKGRWKSMEDLRGNRRSYHHVGEATMESLLEFVSQFECIVVCQLEDYEGWDWKTPELEFWDFQPSTKQI